MSSPILAPAPAPASDVYALVQRTNKLKDQTAMVNRGVHVLRTGNGNATEASGTIQNYVHDSEEHLQAVTETVISQHQTITVSKLELEALKARDETAAARRKQKEAVKMSDEERKDKLAIIAMSQPLYTDTTTGMLPNKSKKKDTNVTETKTVSKKRRRTASDGPAGIDDDPDFVTESVTKSKVRRTLDGLNKEDLEEMRHDIQLNDYTRADYETFQSVVKAFPEAWKALRPEYENDLREEEQLYFDQKARALKHGIAKKKNHPAMHQGMHKRPLYLKYIKILLGMGRERVRENGSQPTAEPLLPSVGATRPLAVANAGHLSVPPTPLRMPPVA